MSDKTDRTTACKLPEKCCIFVGRGIWAIVLTGIWGFLLYMGRLVQAGWMDGCACSRIATAVWYATPTAIKVVQASWRRWLQLWLHLGSATWDGFTCVCEYRKRAGDTMNLDISFVTVITTEVARLLPLSGLIRMSPPQLTASGAGAMWMLQVSTRFPRGPTWDRCTDWDYGGIPTDTDAATSLAPHSCRLDTGCRLQNSRWNYSAKGQPLQRRDFDSESACLPHARAIEICCRCHGPGAQHGSDGRVRCVRQHNHDNGPIHSTSSTVPATEGVDRPWPARFYPNYITRQRCSKLSRNRLSLHMSGEQMYLCLSEGACLLTGGACLSLCMLRLPVLHYHTMLVYLLVSSMGWGCVATKASAGMGTVGPWGMFWFPRCAHVSLVQRGPLYHHLDHHPLSRLPHQLDHRPMFRRSNSSNHRLLVRSPPLAPHPLCSTTHASFCSSQHESVLSGLTIPLRSTSPCLGESIWLTVLLGTLLVCVFLRLAGFLDCARRRRTTWSRCAYMVSLRLLQVMRAAVRCVGDLLLARCRLRPTQEGFSLDGVREPIARTVTVSTQLIRSPWHYDWVSSADPAHSRPTPHLVGATPLKLQSGRTHMGFRRRVKRRERLHSARWDGIVDGLVKATCRTHVLTFSVPEHWMRLRSAGSIRGGALSVFRLPSCADYRADQPGDTIPRVHPDEDLYPLYVLRARECEESKEGYDAARPTLSATDFGALSTARAVAELQILGVPLEHPPVDV